MSNMIPAAMTWQRVTAQHRRRLPASFGFVLSLAPVLAFVISLSCLPAYGAGKGINITIHYIEKKVKRPPTLSNLTAPPKDNTLQGARLGLRDNQTTGRFLNHKYQLHEIIIPAGADFRSEVAKRLKADPARFIIANMPADDLLALADSPEAKGALIFNVAARDTRLRNGDCRANLLHTIPSRKMLADALMQYLVKKRWTKLFLVTGAKPADKLYGKAIRGAIKKFHTRLVAAKPWLLSADIRRTASAEVPVFTQGPDYDVLIVADEAGDFGPYLRHHTWLARPVAGTQGLTPTTWSPVVEQWGAAQLQSRFKQLAGRAMTALDFAAWGAVRVIGGAVTRVNSGDQQKIVSYIHNPKHKFAMYKKVGLSFRPWNGQLRQAIPLVNSDAVVALAPLKGFLHQRSELDTLGLDEPECKCRHRWKK